MSSRHLRLPPLLLVTMLSACQVTPRIGTWEKLLGIQESQVWTIDFDPHSHPIVGASAACGVTLTPMGG